MNKTRAMKQYRERGFTLIELLVVVAVIGILVGLVVGAANYARTRALIGSTKALLATVEAAVEAYNADQGFYPVSSPYHFSQTNGWHMMEFDNNVTLYRALAGGSKKYLSLPSQWLLVQSYSNPTPPYSSTVTGIVDAWGTPLLYYHPWPPIPVAGGVVSLQWGGIRTGGQVNATYDLFSYGPDRGTYPGNNAGGNYGPSNALDDIWSSRQ